MKNLFLTLRRNLFSRLDRYIIFKFLGTYFFSIALIISIAVVFDFSENSDKFTMNHAPVSALIGYYLNFIPFYSNLFSALFIFIAVIFFTSKLADNSEIIAMMSAGVSLSRLLRPYMLSAAFLAGVAFYLGSDVIPKGSVKRLEFEDRYKTKKKPQVAEHVQMQVQPGIIAYVDHFDGQRKSGFNFRLDKFEDKQLVSTLTAQRIQYDTLADERYHWRLSGVRIRTIEGLCEQVTSTAFVDSVILMEPQDLFFVKDLQQTLTNSQLMAYAEKQRERGSAGVKVYEVEYHKRFADPFAAFILSAIGLFMSFRKRKGGMGGSLGIGLGLSAAYIMFQTVSSTFAINGNLPTIIAAWLPNIVFTIIAFWYYRRSLR